MFLQEIQTVFRCFFFGKSIIQASFMLFCFFKIYSNLLEPISGAAPRVALIQKTGIEFVQLQGTVSIMCPAQGYPVPSFM